MKTGKAHIIAELEKQILPLQGYKPAGGNIGFDGGLGAIKYAFPNECFPLGAVHEFFCSGLESVSATGGFIAGIVSALMNRGGVSLWISSANRIFPPALSSFGLEPDKIIFIYLRQEKEIIWAIEEALKCNGPAAVIAETPEISFTASRRFQLAVEQSQVTGFMIRNNPKNLTTACISRWKIEPLPAAAVGDLPGLGHPRWDVQLLKIRNGIPGNWQVEWVAGRFRHASAVRSIKELQRKAV